MKKFLFALLSFSVALFAAEKVYLAPISIIGMHSDYAVVSSKLMKAYIEDDGRYVLVVGNAQDSVSADDQAAVQKKAVEKGCSKYIISEFTRLGENVIMSFKLYGTDSEAPVWDDRLKAKDPDDFDPIIQRVARNIGTKHKATSDNDIYSVTEQETISPNKKAVSSYWGVSISGTVAMQPEADVLAGISLFALYDAGVMFIGLDGNLYGLDNKLSMGNVYISGYYPFGSKAITPYVGMGLGIGYTKYDSELSVPSSGYGYEEYTDEKSGLSGFVGGGVLFNRNTRLMLNVSARYFLNFYKVKNYTFEKKDNGYSQVSSKSHAINGLTLGVGVAYGF